jgi:hypothetical protein
MTARIATFTRPNSYRPFDYFKSSDSGLSGDPFWGSVSYLLLFESDFTDSKSGASFATAGGGTAYSINTTTPLEGVGSLSATGASSWLEVADATANQITTQSFTIEAIVKPTITGSDRTICSKRNTGTNGWALTISSTGTVRLRANIGGSYSENYLLTSTGVIANNTRYHIALTRNGSLWTLWVDGVAITTMTNSGALQAGVPFRIGSGNSSGENPWNGLLDAFRLTMACRYTTTFVPPTIFPAF